MNEHCISKYDPLVLKAATFLIDIVGLAIIDSLVYYKKNNNNDK